MESLSERSYPFFMSVCPESDFKRNPPLSYLGFLLVGCPFEKSVWKTFQNSLGKTGAPNGSR